MNKTFLLFGLLILFKTGFTQKDFIGKWKASCMKEKKDSTSFKVCMLCDAIKELKPNVNTVDFELDFDDTDVTIKASNFTTVKAYEWDAKLNTLDFYYNGIDLKFEILRTNDPKYIVLKNDDHSVIFLTKK